MALLAASAPAAFGADIHGARPSRASTVARDTVRGVLLPVWALLDGRTPVAGGRISVYAGVPGRLPRIALAPLKRRGEPTNAAGVATLEFARLPRTFTVVVRGGRVLGRPLKGSLSAQVHGYNGGIRVDGVGAGPVVHINPVTTLVDALQQVDPRVSEARALRVVERALGVPRWTNAIDLRVNDHWLDGRIFLRDVRAHGTIDRATGALVLEIRTGKRVVSFRAPRAAHAAGVAEWWKETDIGQLVKDGLKTLGAGVVSGIGAAGGTWVLAKFLDAVGLGKFADALCPVCHMVEQLDALTAQVTAVKNLVEEGIQATEQSQYNQLVAKVDTLDGDISGLWEDTAHLAAMNRDDPTLQNYNADLIANIGDQLVHNHHTVSDLNKALAPSTPASYGILQAASAYLGSRKPFYTQASSRTMASVFDYYQLMQLRLSVLLTNYYSTRPETFSPQTIQETVIDKITNNIAGQRALVKPPLPPGSFIDLRTDKSHALKMWGPVTWVNGKTLEHYCVDGVGVRHRFYVNASHLTCDPSGHDSARLGPELATEEQFKTLLDGWEGTTPLEWLQTKTGLTMTAAPKDIKQNHIGFYWVGHAGTPANRAGPVEGPFCKTVCLNDNTLGMYEYIHRYDMQDTSKPSPDAWSVSLGDYDPWNYNANAVLAPKTVKQGEYFWPVGGG